MPLIARSPTPCIAAVVLMLACGRTARAPHPHDAGASPVAVSPGATRRARPTLAAHPSFELAKGVPAPLAFELKKRLPELRVCYEQAYAFDPELAPSGTLAVRLQSGGAARPALHVSSEERDVDRVIECAQSSFARIPLAQLGELPDRLETSIRFDVSLSPRKAFLNELPDTIAE